MKWTKYISIVLLTIIWSCEPKVENTPFTTDLKIVVKDKDGNLINGANVILFDNFASYQASSVINSPAGSIGSGMTNAAGEIDFLNLDHNLNYWVHVWWIDGSSMQQSNLTSQHALLNLLVEDAITTLEITLRLDNVGDVTFWSTGDNTSNLPIEVFFESASQGNLNTTRGTAPATWSDTLNTLVVKDQTPGPYNWYAKGQNGCVWAGQVTVVADTITAVQLSDCDHGSVTFWSQADLTAEGALTVVMDLSDTIGVLNTTIGGAPGACFQPGTVSASKPIGNHIYHVYSASGTCLWNDSFTITENGCTEIELLDCE